MELIVDQIKSLIDGRREDFGHSNYLIGNNVTAHSACYSSITYMIDDKLEALKKDYGDYPLRLLFNDGQLHTRYTHELLNSSAWKDMWITKDVNQGIDEGFVFDPDYFKPVRNMGMQCIRFPTEFGRLAEIDKLWELVPDLTIQEMILLAGNLKLSGEHWTFKNQNYNHTPYYYEEVPLKSFLNGYFKWEKEEDNPAYTHFKKCQYVSLRARFEELPLVKTVTKTSFGDVTTKGCSNESIVQYIHELRKVANE